MAANNIEFSHDELTRALIEAQSDISDDPNFFTAPQLAEMLDIPIKDMRRRLRALIKAGLVEPDRRVIYNYLGGRSSVQGVRWVGK